MVTVGKVGMFRNVASVAAGGMGGVYQYELQDQSASHMVE